jgi:hypothetical protein
MHERIEIKHAAMLAGNKVCFAETRCNSLSQICKTARLSEAATTNNF